MAYLRRSLDLYSAEYEHFIIVGDFNTEVTQTSMKVFRDSYEFKNLIKDATQSRNSPKNIEVANKKCRPPWLGDKENFENSSLSNGL